MANRNRNDGKKNLNKLERSDAHASSETLRWVLPCLAACILFAPVLHFGFVFDDNTLILQNPWVHSWTYLPRLLTSHLWAFRSTSVPIPQYRPMFSVWLLTVYTFGERSTIFWHLSSIALHVTAVYVVFRLSKELIGSEAAAGWAALLFAVHPIHVEPVSWVSSCNELLYTTAVLCSVFLFWRRLQNTADRRAYRWTSIALWAAAIFTKESALPVLVVFFYLACRASDKTLGWSHRVYHAIRQTVSYLGVVVLYFIARFAFIGGIGLSSGRHTWKQVICSAPLITAFYLKKLLVPIHLSSFYFNPLISAPTVQMWVDVVLIFAIIAVLAWVSTRRSPAWGVASMLLFLPMLPVLAGVRVFLDGDLAHDRYMYLPSAALCILGGLAAKYFLSAPARIKKIAKIGGFSMALLLTILTISQEGIYASDRTYFGRGVQSDPNNHLVRDYLGDFYLAHRETDLAITQFQEAHNLAPHDTFATFCLARGLFEGKQYSSAEPYLKALAGANQLHERIPKEMVLLALGQTEINLKKLSNAETALVQLENADDTYPGLHRTMGVMYLMERRIPNAQAEFAREFQVSGDPASEHEAVELGNLMRGSAGAATPSRTGISQ